jgi:hypothetical protein
MLLAKKVVVGEGLPDVPIVRLGSLLGFQAAESDQHFLTTVEGCLVGSE